VDWQYPVAWFLFPVYGQCSEEKDKILSGLAAFSPGKIKQLNVLINADQN
jgi:hypothetical protein